MSQIERNTRINKMYAALREIDSYKYGLHSKDVLMIQSSILVFLKERCITEELTLACTGNDYRSYLMKGVWEQVMRFCYRSIEMSPLYWDLYKKIKDWSPMPHECEMLLDALIENQGRVYNESVSPTDELAELALKLLDYKDGVVYNPNAGDGTFGRHLNIGGNYFGATDSEAAWSIGIAKMLLQDKIPSDNYVLTPNRPLEVCTYDRYINIFRPREFEYEDVFSKLNAGGKAVILLPPGELLDRRNKTNEKLIRHNVLDKVIILPTSLLTNTSVGTALLVCRSGREENAPVTMLDASGEKYYERDSRKRTNILDVSKVLSDIADPEKENRIEVSPEAIADERYNLSPFVYMRPDEPLPEGYEISALKDLTKPAEFSRKSLFREGMMVTPSTLELNQTDFHIDVNLLTATDDRRGEGGLLMTKSCVLVAPRSRSIGAAYYKYTEGDQIYAHPLLMALEVDESRIDPEYLVFKLRSADMNIGSSSISRSFVLNTPIAYPPLAEQRRIVEDTVKANKLAKIRELGLTEEVQRLKNEYKRVIRTKKHNLGTLRENISATLRELQKQANRSTQSGEIDLQVLYRRVNRLVDYWKDLDGRLDKIADENIFKEAEEFDFDSYFRELESQEMPKNYVISYFLDKGTFDDASAKIAINVNPDDFKQVVENIINNAEKHGFSDSQRGDYYLNIRVYCEEDPNGIQRTCFLFENNGNPAPVMTKEQFGTAGWHSDVKGSKGDGDGGAYISEMTRNFGGDYEPPTSITDDIGEYCRTLVMICFPAIVSFTDDEQ